jgi:phospholipase/carboxylesterase
VKQKIAGIVALSTYIPLPHLFESEIKQMNSDTPLFMAQGTGDSVIPLAVAQRSYGIIGKAKQKFQITSDMESEFFTYANMDHTTCAQEMNDLIDFLRRVIPQQQQ